VRHPRRLLAAATVACVLPLGAAQADGDGFRPRDNVATAHAQADGANEFDLAWEVRHERKGDVDHRNLARAIGQCTDCKATAIAFQVVLASGDRIGAVAPENKAYAINSECTRCVTHAAARQFVRVVDRPVKFTREGREALEQARRALRALEGRDLTVNEFTAEIERQEAVVLDALTTQVVPREGHGQEHVVDRDDRADDDD
jgi:hypothetical protein